MYFSAQQLLGAAPSELADDHGTALWWLAGRGYLSQIAEGTRLTLSRVEAMVFEPATRLGASAERPVWAVIDVGRADGYDADARKEAKAWLAERKLWFREFIVVSPTSNRFVSMAVRATVPLLKLTGLNVSVATGLYAVSQTHDLTPAAASELE